MTKSKLLLVIVFLATIFWLMVSPRKGHRREKLNQALKTGKLGRLPEKTEQNLNRLLLAFHQCLGISEEICLNCSLDTSAKLRVYTCDPTQMQLTGCAMGNAIYDRELNAIFIDESLISPDAWNAKGTFGTGHANLPFLEVYLKFVLLHELGHYFLHRNAGRSFDLLTGDGSVMLRGFEAQADSFAVARFTEMLAKDTTGLLFSPAVAENLAMDEDEKLSPSDKTLMCLTLMARNINLGMLFGVSPYSEFYADKAHTSFMNRSAGFLSKALEVAPIRNKYYGKADLIRAQLVQIDQIAAAHAILEIRIPAPLLNLGFDREGLLVQTMDSTLYHAQYEWLQIGDRPGVAEGRIDPVTSNRLIFDLDALFSFRTGESFSSCNGQLFTLNRAHWSAIRFQDGVPRNPDKVAMQPQPADSTIYLSDNDSLYQMHANRMLLSLSRREIKIQAASLFHIDSPEILWDQPLINGPDVRFTALLQNGLYWKLAGALLPDFVHRTVKSMERFNLDEPRIKLAAEQFDFSKSRLLYNPMNNSYYLLTSQVPGFPDVKMQLWALFADRQPRLVSERTFLNGNSIARNLLSVEPTLVDRSIAYLNGANYIVNWDDDMIYRINLDSGAMEPIFHFGAGTLGLRVSKDGQLAIFSPLGYKFFVMKP